MVLLSPSLPLPRWMFGRRRTGNNSQGEPVLHAFHPLESDPPAAPSSSSSVRAAAFENAPVALPTCFNPRDKFALLDLSEGNLRVSYKGEGRRDTDAASVRANLPIPVLAGIYYYEVRVVNKGRDGYIGVGLCTAGVNLNRLPGWEANSIGYHGDDGNAFRGSGRGVQYGPPFTTGDTIGCCLDFLSNSVFYTKNGRHLGVAFRDVKGEFYPVLGLRTPGEVVEANFGARPFVFDIEAYRGEGKARFLRQIEESVLPRREPVCIELVMNFLIHYGFTETALLFQHDTGIQIEGEEIKAMKQRQQIRELILAGRIDDAIQELAKTFPGVLPSSPSAVFELKRQKFVELLKVCPVEDVIAFGQQQLSHYDDESEEHKERLQEVFSLLAYSDPSACPFSHLLDPALRESVADVVNNAIMTYTSKSSAPALVRLVQQAHVVHEELLNSSTPQAVCVSINDWI